MRHKIEPSSAQRLFRSLEDAGYDVPTLSRLLGVHERTIRDWRRGKYTIPHGALNQMLQQANLSRDIVKSEQVGDWWYASAAGRKGGRIYMKKYGTLGDERSRKLGGETSYRLRHSSKVDIYARKQILTPPHSAELAEFCGIMMGDGSIGAYQISIALDSRSDAIYAKYVMQLVKNLFGLVPRLRVRHRLNCVVVEVSSVELAEQLVGLGLPFGDKLKQGLSIPCWIQENGTYLTRCIRGLFDTDGSVFQEVHTIKGKRYGYKRLSFVSASTVLLDEFRAALTGLGICSKKRGAKTIKIERFTDIENYFKIVGSSNPKHLYRYHDYGGVG